MSERKWAYKPGEYSRKKIIQSFGFSDDNLLKKFLDLTEYHTETTGSKRTMVLNDNKEVVFFVELGNDVYSVKRTTVYVWDGDEYHSLSDELADKVSKKYFDYLDAMSEAYEFLGEEL
jgi:hypothetical protein